MLQCRRVGFHAEIRFLNIWIAEDWRMVILTYRRLGQLLPISVRVRSVSCVHPLTDRQRSSMHPRVRATIPASVTSCNDVTWGYKKVITLTWLAKSWFNTLYMHKLNRNPLYWALKNNFRRRRRAVHVCDFKLWTYTWTYCGYSFRDPMSVILSYLWF